jgi:hypothetical protein
MEKTFCDPISTVARRVIIQELVVPVIVVDHINRINDEISEIGENEQQKDAQMYSHQSLTGEEASVRLPHSLQKSLKL